MVERPPVQRRDAGSSPAFGSRTQKARRKAGLRVTQLVTACPPRIVAPSGCSGTTTSEHWRMTPQAALLRYRHTFRERRRPLRNPTILPPHCSSLDPLRDRRTRSDSGPSDVRRLPRRTRRHAQSPSAVIREHSTGAARRSSELVAQPVANPDARLRHRSHRTTATGGRGRRRPKRNGHVAADT